MTEEEQQLIKAGAEAALKPFANLMERLFGGSVDQIGGGWEDALSTRRKIRQIKLFKKLQKAIDEAGFAPRQLQDDFSVPALLQASLVDDETLQTKWANLLANGADPREEAVLVSPAFVDVLKELSARDVKFLDALYNAACELGGSRAYAIDDYRFEKDELWQVYAHAGLSRLKNLGMITLADTELPNYETDHKADAQESEFTIAVAMRQGILTSKTEVSPIDFGVIAQQGRSYSPIDPRGKLIYTFTQFGASFVAACRKPKPQEKRAKE